MSSRILFITSLLLAAIQTVRSQAVFAHVLVGVNAAAGYTQAQWQSDMTLASGKGIDAFALNIATPLAGSTSTQIALAFAAATNLAGSFKLFFSFDYDGGSGPWSTNDILSVLNQYASNSAHYQYNGKPFVSTFEGPGNSDVSQWATIRSSMANGIYFVPDWTSQGPGWNQNLIDGAFSWDMWPNGPNNMTTAPDQAWQNSLKPAGKSYMMGVSPWYYTNLPGYGKAWVWRGDSLWYDRWIQTQSVLPQFVEIVSWNDYGESHYIGPIVAAGIPSAPGADARPYVTGMNHIAWLQTLPYQIAAYKHAANSSKPAVIVASGRDRIIYWYRLAPASAGYTNATCNACPSAVNSPGNSYQQCYPISQCLEDGVFAIALLSQAGESVSMQIGSNPVRTFAGLKAGISLVSMSFGAQTGNVTVKSSSGVSGTGPAILSAPPNGNANFNAWVGCAGYCS